MGEQPSESHWWCLCIHCGQPSGWNWFCPACSEIKEAAYAESARLGETNWYDILARRDAALLAKTRIVKS